MVYKKSLVKDQRIKNMSHTILTDILIVFIVAVPVAYLFHKLKLPPIIGFLVTGALIGPAGAGLVQDIDRINLLAQVGVALLVFSLGLEFSLKHFGEIKGVAIGGGILQIILTASLVVISAISFGFTWQNGILLGSALSLSSTAIVYHVLSQQRLTDSPHGRIAAGILVFQDLSSIPMIALLPLLSMSSGAIDVFDISAAVFKIIAVAGTFLLGQKFIIPWVLHRITLTRSKELFLITILLIALGFGFLTNEMGLSFALGAFLAGLMVADTDFRFHALSEIAPFRYCFNGLFFVSIGMLFHPAFLTSHWGLVAVILFVLPIGKALISTLAVGLLGYPVNVAAMAGLSLSQVGEFSFLILLVAKKTGAIPEPLYDFTIAAAFLTILITPAVMHASPATVNFIERILPLKWIRGRKRLAAINAEELKNHVIICGFGPLGSSVGHILEEAEREYLVLELNPATVRKIKNLRGGRPVYLGDGASAEILYKSGIERASALAITAPDYMNSISIIKQARAMNPELKIITRARFRSQVSELYAAGADIVISEELEAGIEMGRYILLHMGVDEATIEQYIQTIRAFGSADFF